ncbi:MAG: hypothetical protein Q9159_000078 [Coniocarpon cinnabarinum]
MEADHGFQIALEEARTGAQQGGVPIGAAVVDAGGHVLGRGHNMRFQKNSNTSHGPSALGSDATQERRHFSVSKLDAAIEQSKHEDQPDQPAQFKA